MCLFVLVMRARVDAHLLDLEARLDEMVECSENGWLGGDIGSTSCSPCELVLHVAQLGAVVLLGGSTIGRVVVHYLRRC